MLWQTSTSVLFVICLGTCHFSLAFGARGVFGKDHKETRTPKLFSLFNIVSFQNDGCASNGVTGSGSTRNGTCFTAEECQSKGGVNSGNCASGFGVCCVFTVENSGDNINQNCSYMRNPGFPATYSGSDTTFMHTINKCTCSVCFIRLDFEAFALLGPGNTEETGGGACVDTFMVTSGSGQNVPTICGMNGGKHMYVETGTGCGDSITVNMRFTGSSTIRRWDIKATQVECNSPMAPPAGCTEYLTTSAGRITSFNWDNVGETHLASQDQLVCVRSTLSSCCIQYTLCDDPLAMSLLLDNADLTMTNPLQDTNCKEDYIQAESFTPECTSLVSNSLTANRLCGGKFNTVAVAKIDAEVLCDCSNDFSLLIHTDADTDNAAAGIANTADRSRGVCLDYKLISC